MDAATTGLSLPNTNLPTTAAQAKAFMSTSFPDGRDSGAAAAAAAADNTNKGDKSIKADPSTVNGASTDNAGAADTTNAQEESASGIVPTLQNIVATVNLDCRLDLKTIALHARNAEYNPKVCIFMSFLFLLFKMCINAVSFVALFLFFL